MKRVWFNKTFSSIHAAIGLIREGDTAGHYSIVCSSTNPHALGFLAAHESAVEPAGLPAEAYLEWCLHVCGERAIDRRCG